jgi:hypothetical protein
MTTPLIAPQATTDSSTLKRRGLLLGVGAAGAAALAIKTLPTAATAGGAVAGTAAKVVDPSGGYQVTAHVLRYYETTRA